MTLILTALLLFSSAPALAATPYISPISCASTREDFDLTTARVYLDRNKGEYNFTLYGGPAKVHSTWITDTYEVLSGREPNAYLRRLVLSTVPDEGGFMEASFSYAANRPDDKAYPLVCKRLAGQRLVISSMRADNLPPGALREIALSACGGGEVNIAGKLESRFSPIWCGDCSMRLHSQAFLCR
jgi:hypothetical protein